MIKLEINFKFSISKQLLTQGPTATIFLKATRFAIGHNWNWICQKLTRFQAFSINKQ